MIAANIPDVDAVAMLLGTEGLAIRRGITHGPIAMLVLPALLTALVLAYDRWRPSQVPVRPKALLLLAYIGTLSHPALDFLNSYGIRLLEPFSSRWFAADTLFIIDVWIWGALILSFAVSRWREKRGGKWRRPAWIGFAAIGAYIAANGLITTHAESLTGKLLKRLAVEPELVVASPVPVQFWKRQMLWRTAGQHGDGSYDALAREFAVSTWLEPSNLDHPALAASRDRSDVRAFLFWSRMPIVVEHNGRAFLADQRFRTSMTRGSFLVPLDSPAPGP